MAHLGHIAVIFVNAANQGFYFSFGPSDDTHKGEIGKAVECIGQVVLKLLIQLLLMNF